MDAAILDAVRTRLLLQRDGVVLSPFQSATNYRGILQPANPPALGTGNTRLSVGDVHRQCRPLHRRRI